MGDVEGQLPYVGYQRSPDTVKVNVSPMFWIHLKAKTTLLLSAATVPLGPSSMSHLSDWNKLIWKDLGKRGSNTRTKDKAIWPCV